MERDETTTPDDLDRPDGNDLESNYELHDCGEAAFHQRVDESIFEAEPWGIDRRDDGGEDGIIYDDKLDFKVFGPDGNLVGLVDVKTKSSPKYMGTYNERHYVKYHEKAKEHDVPTFVVMYQVDWDTEEIHDAFVHFVGGKKHAVKQNGDLYDDVYTSSSSDAVSTFPDGNVAVLVPHDERESIGDMFTTLTIEAATAADNA